MTTAIPMASGIDRLGFLASPPACAIESKPMKLLKSSAEAPRKVPQRKGAAGASAITTPSRSRTAAANSSCPKEKPAKMTTLPRTNIRNISGTSVRS